jgi:hypothetical protein
VPDKPVSPDNAPTGIFADWAPLLGRWDRGQQARYHGPSDGVEPAVGMLRAPDSFSATGGTIATTITFPADAELEPQGRIMFGFNPRTQAHYSAGLGGYGSMFSIEQFVPREGYASIVNVGRADALQRDRPYEVTVFLNGQDVMLDVDDVVIADASLPRPLEGSRVGLTGRGIGSVIFDRFDVSHQAPEAFIVMQFGPPFDDLYREVVAPVCAEMGYAPIRADEFAGPGIIIQDIIAGIRRASVVIAEVTPVNGNVFYELGYAQALGKPTILLADRNQLATLPFDISSNRCIFYNDSIGGKTRVEQELRRHLDAIV